MVTEEGLTRRTVRGAAWTWGGALVVAVLQVAYMAAISRLLPPSDFGLMAAAVVGVRFVTYLSRFGLAPALIQRPAIDRRVVSTAWWTALAVACVAGGLTLLVAPAVAAIVRTPQAAPVLRWMSVAVVAGALGLIPDALIRREFRFRAAAIIQVVSYVVGLAGVGLFGAWQGWGVWSLVAAYTGQAVVLLVLSSVVAGRWPRLEFDRSASASMLRFGGTVSLTGFIDFLSANVDTLAVGRYAGPSALGQYYRASLLVALPTEQASTSIVRVLLPGLSRVQFDRDRFARAVVSAVGVQALVVTVPAAVLAASAELVVPLLLGPGWGLAASVLPILALGVVSALLTVVLAVAAESKGAVVLRLAVQSTALATTVVLIGVVVATGPSVLRLAGAWGVGELVRLTLYVVVVAAAIDVDRLVIASRYAIAVLLASCAAGPVWLAVHQLGTGWPGVILAGLVGLGLVGVVWMSPLVGPLRSDVGDIVRRVRTGAAGPGSGPVEMM